MPYSQSRLKLLGQSLLAAAICIAAAFNCAQAEDNWPQWRGPLRDGVSPSKGLNWDWNNKAPKLIWMAEGMGSGYSSVSVDEGMIYTTGNFPNGQAVVAANTDGTVKWKTPLTGAPPKHGYDGARCTPAIDGDHLYVVGSHGEIYCLARGEGKIVWQRPFSDWQGKMMSGWGFSESPLVDGDWVLCTPGGRKGLIVALDKKTGKEVWSAEMPAEKFANGKDGAGYSSIVVSEGAGVKQYIQLTGRGVVSVRATDGKVLWVYNPVANGVANIPTPIVDGDFVFCSTGYGTGSALLHLTADGDGVNATEKYFLGKNDLQNHHGGMVLRDGYVYCGHGHNDGRPICVEMKSGETVWGGRTRGVGKGSAAAMLADGHLLLRYQTGELAALEATPTSLKVVGEFKPEFQQGKSWAHPVIVGTRLYLREQDKLMCYDLAK